MRNRFRAEGPVNWGKDGCLPTLETEENPVVGRLLGPDGSTVKIVRAKNTVPFGPQPTAKE